MDVRVIRLVRAGVVAMVLWCGLALAQPTLVPRSAAPTAPTTPAAPPPAIATVAARRIARSEFDQRAIATLQQYRERLGNAVPEDLQPMVRRQVLEMLIRRELMILEAQRRNLTGTVAEAEAVLQKEAFFNPGGKFDPNRLAQVKQGNPAMWNDAVRTVQTQIGAQKLSESLEKQYAPSAAEARASAERALTRARLDVLGLRRAEFLGITPEPREPAVLDYYNRHAESYRRPERAVLSAITVREPALTDAQRGDAAQMRQWNDTMRRRADSLLAAIKGGTSFESASEPFGGPRGNVIVTRDNFPGFWQGPDAQKREVFTSRPGALLGEPVQADEGWMVVRIDEVRPSQVAAFREVSREIRAKLRTEARTGGEELELRAMYPALADSLRATGYKVRYAVCDPASMRAATPRGDELERWYRGHIADYSTYDPATSSIKARPFAEVQAEVQARWEQEQRTILARSTAEAIESAWRRGRRDSKSEREATLLRDVGPAVVGAAVDTGRAGRMVGDSLSARRGALGVGAGESDGRLVVFHIYQSVPDVAPTFEQARPILVARARAARDARDEAGARQLFEAHPERFGSGDVMHFTRVLVEPMPLLHVPLSRQDVERYYASHIDRYTAPEEIRVRHALFLKGRNRAADSTARARAESVRQRARAGEDFATLASHLTEDTATRSKGGDLGWFGRGAMLAPFEQAAFALKPGEISDVVETEVGYHVIQMVDRQPAVAQPLVTMWVNVGSDAAKDRADLIAAQRADSLWRACKTPARLRDAARRMGLEITSYHMAATDQQITAEMRPVIATLRELKPGQMYPGTYALRGLGNALAWIDSITPPVRLNWDSARQRALEMYRAGAGERALVAKEAEIDSMLRAGVSLDSAGAYWGGLQAFAHTWRGPGLPGLGGGEMLDSLVFGSARTPAALQVGQSTGWLALPEGAARVRYEERVAPSADQVAARAESERRTVQERKLMNYFDELKTRYPVKILDPILRDTALPALPPENP